MKQQKIYMKAWLDAHGRAKAVDTDEWYLDFANQLLPLVADSFIYGGREWEEDQKRVALTCALYLEDCVATEEIGVSLFIGTGKATDVICLFTH